MTIKFTNIILIITILIFFLSLFSCTSSLNNNEITFISFNNDFNLTDSEKDEHINKAINGNIDSSVRLSNYFMYYMENNSEGMKWLEKAAKAGHTISQYNLAHIYFLNNKEYELSRFWYLKAAKSGFTKAMTKLAEMYEYGYGTKINLEQANKYYESAALGGEINSILKMIEYCKEGKGGVQNIQQSLVWLMIAENQIAPNSVTGKRINHMKRDILKHLTTSELKQAENEFNILSHKIRRKSY